jgi:hypothetical protein
MDRAREREPAGGEREDQDGVTPGEPKRRKCQSVAD